MLTELVLRTAEVGSSALDPMFAGSYDAAGGDAEKLRIVLDQVSLLTDAQAITRHRRLMG